MGRYRKYYRYNKYKSYNKYRNKNKKTSSKDDLMVILAVFIVLFSVLVFNFAVNHIIVFAIILIIISLLTIIYVLIKNRERIRNKYMFNRIKTSHIYNDLIELNNSYNFDKIVPFYSTYNVGFKSNLRTCNIDDYLLMTLNDNYGGIAEYKKRCSNLRSLYVDYENAYVVLYNKIDEEYPDNEKYNSYMKNLFAALKKPLLNEFEVIISIKYSSRMGRVREGISKRYNYIEYKQVEYEYFQLRTENRLYEISSRVERAKMSESMRYDVFKRDGFRCRICGASANDGAKLHVDHIIPISKGGRTRMDNLQTLCDRCNIGKGNKM